MRIDSPPCCGRHGRKSRGCICKSSLSVSCQGFSFSRERNRAATANRTTAYGPHHHHYHHHHNHHHHHHLIIIIIIVIVIIHHHHYYHYTTITITVIRPTQTHEKDERIDPPRPPTRSQSTCGLASTETPTTARPRVRFARCAGAPAMRHLRKRPRLTISERDKTNDCSVILPHTKGKKCE